MLREKYLGVKKNEFILSTEEKNEMKVKKKTFL